MSLILEAETFAELAEELDHINRFPNVTVSTLPGTERYEVNVRKKGIVFSFTEQLNGDVCYRNGSGVKSHIAQDEAVDILKKLLSW